MKIFGIGFHKTGTSTLEKSLTTLGYKVCGPRTDLAKTLFDKNLSPVFNLVEEYDAFQDNPWPLLFKELDQQYPNSKFILTIRNDHKWINSVVNHFGENHTEMRRWIYGVGIPKGNEEVYLRRYNSHNKEVMEYFKNRPDDLLVVSWENGDGWMELCNFLNKPIPKKDFPHINKASYSKTKKQFLSLKNWFRKKLNKIN